MENLISLIIDLLSALFGNRDDKRPPPPPRPDPSRPRSQPGPTSWENELRRLLDSQGQQAAPPPRPTQPVAPPQIPRLVTVNRPVPVVIGTPTVAPDSSSRVRPVLIPPPIPPGRQSLNQPFATLSESQQAYARASQLDKAAARIERVPGQKVQLTTVIRQPVSAEIAQVVSLFKNPQAARQAVIASIIFGPPRAFHEETSANF